MKRYDIPLALVAILLISITLPVNTYAETFDFRKTRWGMSKKEVLAAENAKLIDDAKETLSYAVTVRNKKCHLIYWFIDGELFQANYGVIEPHSNLSLYVDDYRDFVSLLKKKYGSPLADQVEWKNNLFKNDPQRWGLAVSMGHAVFSAKWKTHETIIGCVLAGDNDKIALAIFYYSIRHKDRAKKSDEQKTMDDM